MWVLPSQKEFFGTLRAVWSKSDHGGFCDICRAFFGEGCPGVSVLFCQVSRVAGESVGSMRIGLPNGRSKGHCWPSNIQETDICNLLIKKG